MAAEQNLLRLRIPKVGYRELIILWFPITNINNDDLDEFTKLLVETFTEATDCVNYAKENTQYTKLFLIISEGINRSGRDRIEELERLLRLSNHVIPLHIFVLHNDNCNNVADHHPSAQYFNDFRELSIRLEECLSGTNISGRSLSGSTNSLDTVPWNICDGTSLKKQNFVIYWKHLLVDKLRELNQPRTEIQRGIDSMKQYYSNDKASLAQITRFEDTYFLPDKENDSICRFTSGNFLSKFLQRALQTKNMEQLFPLRFFIRDLYQQLQHIQTKTPDHSDIVVYRSMIPPHNYRHRTNELITMDTFFSTSMSHDLAVIFAEEQSVIYEIHTGPKENTGFVFANLSQLNNDANNTSELSTDQQEVLFALYTSFRIDDVRMEENPRHVVLRLLNRDDFNAISRDIIEESEHTPYGKERLLKCGKYWEDRNDIDKAVNYYKKLFTILLSNENEYIKTISDKLEQLYAEEETNIPQ